MSSSSSSQLYQMPESDQAIVKSLKGNDRCADCQTVNPTWASVSFGTLLCIKHSGEHRGLGTHISFVRSVEMDSWTAAQLEQMKRGGNDACNEFLRKHGVVTNDIKEKYSSSAAQLYKEVLKARVQGKPEPTELPKASDQNQKPHTKKRMEGIGSSPPPRKDSRFKNIALVGCSVVAVVVGWVFLKAKK